MHHVKSAPPLAPLEQVVGRLERAGLVVALGGSGLLAALGLETTVHDWDLTTDAPLESARAALAGEPLTLVGSNSLHADRKLVLSSGTVELIVGLAFHAPGGVVRLPTRVSGRRDGIPLGSPEVWAVAYHLLGREVRSQALLARLGTHGADRERIAELLEQPLPTGIAGRLAALLASRDT